MIETTIPIIAQIDGDAFDGNVDLVTEEHGWKTMLIVPEQSNEALYDVIIREAIKATQCRIDIHSLTVLAVDEDGFHSVVDFEPHPTLFVANSKHTEPDASKVFARMQGTRVATVTTQDLAQLAALPPKVFEAVARFRTAITHARKGHNDFGLPPLLNISADDAETILSTLARVARLHDQLNAVSSRVE